MELTSRYGLEFNPFLKNSKEILFCSAEYNEALARLTYLCSTKGFGLLTGAPGRGKTTLVRNWSHSLNPSLYEVSYSSLSTLTVNEFYRNLAFHLGEQPMYRKPDNFRLIQNAINRIALEKHKTPVIIIDEANLVPNAVLNDLKILFNFEQDSRDRAIILLVGLPQLNNTLRLSVHEPLRQRIIMNYHLEGLSKEEGRDYIIQKIKGAGGSEDIMEPSAMEAILNAADGTPRIICKLCNTALVIGHSISKNIIDSDIAMQAINECTLG